ncbi:MAG: hypothetical protein INR62_04300 [Rhodospirillales bacterium]|nr:hypothetical protein [Acetobacter sp.]
MVRWSTLTANEAMEEGRVPGEYIDEYDDDKPTDIQIDTAALWQHFNRLSAARGSGNGFSGVPSQLLLSEIRALYEFEGLGRSWMPREFIDAMQLCDREFLKCRKEQAEWDKSENERRKRAND